MPTRNLQKVQKSVNRKKGGGAALHERSRDAKRIKSASARQDKLVRLATQTDLSQRPYIDRMLWFQEAASQLDAEVTVDNLRQLAEQCINRNDNEIKELEAARRSGRPPSGQEIRMKQRRDIEKTEFAAGLWMPDLRNAETLKLLEQWSGEWAGLAEMNYCRMSKDGTAQASKFPPKGGN